LNRVREDLLEEINTVKTRKKQREERTGKKRGQKGRMEK
jgi:hypothetical protein